MEGKKKASAAKMRSIQKWEAKNYFKTLVRFRADDEDRIRAAAGDSVNGFIVRAVMDAVTAYETGARDDTAGLLDTADVETIRAAGLDPAQIAAQAIKDAADEIRAGIR